MEQFLLLYFNNASVHKFLALQLEIYDYTHYTFIFSIYSVTQKLRNNTYTKKYA